MRLFQAALDTSLDSPLLCPPLSSRFALHGLRAFESQSQFAKPLRFWCAKGPNLVSVGGWDVRIWRCSWLVPICLPAKPRRDSLAHRGRRNSYGNKLPINAGPQYHMGHFKIYHVDLRDREREKVKMTNSMPSENWKLTQKC